MSAIPQTALDEQVLEDPSLEAALEERQDLKARLSAVRKPYREADDRVKGLLAAVTLDAGESIRIGRFRVSKRDVASRALSFETGERTQLTIACLED